MNHDDKSQEGKLVTIDCRTGTDRGRGPLSFLGSQRVRKGWTVGQPRFIELCMEFEDMTAINQVYGKRHASEWT